MLKNLVLSCLMVLAVAGCATDFNTKLATGYQSVTAVRSTTLTLLKANTITVKDAQNVQDVADKARTALDIAEDVHKSNPDLGEDKLNSAIDILKSVQKYLGELLK